MQSAKMDFRRAVTKLYAKYFHTDSQLIRNLNNELFHELNDLVRNTKPTLEELHEVSTKLEELFKRAYEIKNDDFSLSWEILRLRLFFSNNAYVPYFKQFYEALDKLKFIQEYQERINDMLRTIRDLGLEINKLQERNLKLEDDLTLSYSELGTLRFQMKNMTTKMAEIEKENSLILIERDNHLLRIKELEIDYVTANNLMNEKVFHIEELENEILTINEQTQMLSDKLNEAQKIIGNKNQIIKEITANFEKAKRLNQNAKKKMESLAEKQEQMMNENLQLKEQLKEIKKLKTQAHTSKKLIRLYESEILSLKEKYKTLLEEHKRHISS